MDDYEQVISEAAQEEFHQWQEQLNHWQQHENDERELDNASTNQGKILQYSS